MTSKTPSMTVNAGSTFNLENLTLKQEVEKKERKLKPPPEINAFLTLSSYLSNTKDLLNLASVSTLTRQLKGDPRFWELVAKTMNIPLEKMGIHDSSLPFNQFSQGYQNQLQFNISKKRTLEWVKSDKCICTPEVKNDLIILYQGSFNLAFVQSFKKTHLPASNISDQDLGDLLYCFVNSVLHSRLGSQKSLVNNFIEALKGDNQTKLERLRGCSNLTFAASEFKDYLKGKKFVLFPGGVKLMLTQIPKGILEPSVVKGRENIKLDDILGIIQSTLNLQNEEFHFSLCGKPGMTSSPQVNYNIDPQGQKFSLTISQGFALQIVTKESELPLALFLRQMAILQLPVFPIKPQIKYTFTGVELEKFKSEMEEAEKEPARLIHVFWKIMEQTAKENSTNKPPAIMLALQGKHEISVDKQKGSFTLSTTKESHIGFNASAKVHIKDEKGERDVDSHVSGVFLFDTQK